jgi:four helix bundle protein
MRRASSSVTANIAEGFGRQTYREKVQFYYLANGSLAELRNFILIAKDVDYLTDDKFRVLFDQSVIVEKILHGFIKKSKTFIQSK